MSSPGKTEAEFVNEVRAHLEEIIKVMDEAAEQSLTINFGINSDVVTKKSTITALTITRSFL